MKKYAAVLALLAAGMATACGRPAPARARGLPAGDAIWFEDGVGADADKTEETLLRGGLGLVFLPAARLSRQGVRWESRALPAPGRPFARVSTILVLGTDDTFGDAVGKSESIRSLTDGVSLAVQGLLRDTSRYGPVAGVHLDLPFSALGTETYETLLSSVRKRVPRNMLLTVSVRFTPKTPDDREKLKALSSSCDGFLAFLFGEDAAADPVAMDSLEAHWWAGYAPSARGTWQTAAGETRGSLPEWVLARLSDDPSVDFLQNISLKEDTGQTFFLRPRFPITLEKFSFAAGDRLLFSQPLLSDLIFRVGNDVRGRRFARGRVVVLPGRAESERLFTLAALLDVLAGKPAKPELKVTVETGNGIVTLSAENLSPHTSIVSRTSNWVEIHIPSGGIRDIQPGGFDRFEVFGQERVAVTMGRATTVRFYETLIRSFETIQPARILLRGPAPKECCETRYHFIASSGKEFLSDAPTGPAAK